MNKMVFLTVLFAIYLALDLYVFYAIKPLLDTSTDFWRKVFSIGYWGASLFLILGIVLFVLVDPKQYLSIRAVLFTVFGILFFSKIFASVFVIIDDVRRGITFLINLFPFVENKYSESRASFISKTALIAGSIPIATMTFGIISGAHDYRVRKRSINFNNLPKAFDGIRVAQISDIHTGSFFNKTAVQGGVDLMLDQRPDITFFTGDLVNNRSDEAKEYLDIFKKIKSPLGVYAVMVNHDYGDYTQWSSQSAKQQDIKNLHAMHKYMDYDLLLNEHRMVRVDGEEIAILGCENWGTGRFSKYGDMKKTVDGLPDAPFKVLLSHDPSHWDAEIRPDYSDIDLTLSGHTHGMQFGIEIGDFRWSPVKYRYKQWADLYREEDQYMYVNRGYGYIGYPGRIGILPEITILELKRG